MALNQRALHWVFKIGNLKKNEEFYRAVLGMKVLRHEEFLSGCDASCNGNYSRPWSKTMIGYGEEKDHFVFELTYNYGIKKYEKGDDFVAVYLEGKQEIVERANKANYQVHEEDGTTFLLSPDDYKFILLPKSKRVDPVRGVAFNVSSLSNSIDFYTRVLEMKQVEVGDIPTVANASTACLSYAPAQAVIHLIERADKKEQAINHAKAFGRIAFSIKDIQPVYKAVKENNDKILHEPVTLKTPGKADVEVVIVQDRDDYEICFVGEEGFDDLSQLVDGADHIDWAARAENGADR